MAAFTVCFAGLVVLGGIMADWVNPVALMMGSNLVRGLLQCGMAGLFFSRHVNLWTVCGCTALIGVATASFQPGLAGVVPRLGVDVQKANASVRMAESAIRMAGPAAAGALLGVGAVRNIFLICGITYLISACCLAPLGRLLLPVDGQQETTRGGARRQVRAELTAGWAHVRSRNWLCGGIAAWTFFNVFAYGPGTPLTASVVISTEGATTYAWLSSASGIGMILGGLVAMRWRPPRPLRAGALVFTCSCLQPGLVAVDAPIRAQAVGFALTGGAVTIWGVMWNSSIQTHVPAPYLSRVYAVGAGNCVTLCDLRVFVDEAAESIASGDACVVGGGEWFGVGGSVRCPLSEGSVGPVSVVVLRVLVDNEAEGALSVIRMRSVASRRHDPIQRSAIAFIRGTAGSVGTTRMPAAWKTASKLSVK